MVHPRRRAFLLTNARAALFHAFVIDAEHFQPGLVLLGSMLEKVHTCDVALRPIALSAFADQTRAFRAENVHPKAQRFRLSIIVHG